MSQLTISNLACQRGNRLLFNGIMLMLDCAEIMQILGPNGSGKTTLLRALLGLAPVYRGNIKWRGVDVSNDRHYLLQDVCYLGHQIAVKKNLTVLENLQYDWRLANAHQGQCLFMLNHLQLIQHQDRLCCHLSQGERQRVALARILLSDAPLLILDEPFNGLDLKMVAWVQQWLVKQLDNQKSIIFTSHQSLPWFDTRLKQMHLNDCAGIKHE